MRQNILILFLIFSQNFLSINTQTLYFVLYFTHDCRTSQIWSTQDILLLMMLALIDDDDDDDDVFSSGLHPHPGQ